LLDQAVVSITGFLTGIFVARMLGIEAFGAYVLANGAYLLINAIQQGLILSPVSVYAASSDQKVPEYLHGSRLLQLTFSITTSVMFAALAYILGKTTTNTYIQVAFLLMAPLAFFLLSQEFWRQVLIARQKLQALLLVDMAGKGITLLLLAGLAFLISDHKTLPDIYAVLIISAGIGSTIGWMYTRRFLKRGASIIQHWERNYHFGKWAIVSQSMIMATSQIPLYILAFLASTGDTGIFGAAVHITGVFHVFLNGIANYYLPIGVREYESGGALALRRFTWKLILKFFYVVTPISLLCLVFAEELVYFVYQEEFLARGATPFQVFFSVAIVLAIIKPLDIALRIREKMKRRAGISLLELIFVSAAYFPLISTLGVTGAAIVAVGGRIIAMIALLHFVRGDLQNTCQQPPLAQSRKKP